MTGQPLGLGGNPFGNYEFLPDYPSDLQCPVCLNPFHEPVEILPCRHLVCSAPCFRGLNQCPECRNSFTPDQVCGAHRVIINLINQLPGFCRACNWRGNRQQFMDFHERSCAGPSAGAFGLPKAEYEDVVKAFSSFDVLRYDAVGLPETLSLCAWLNLRCTNHAARQFFSAQATLVGGVARVKMAALLPWYCEHKPNYTEEYGLTWEVYSKVLSWYRTVLKDNLSLVRRRQNQQHRTAGSPPGPPPASGTGVTHLQPDDVCVLSELELTDLCEIVMLKSLSVTLLRSRVMKGQPLVTLDNALKALKPFVDVEKRQSELLAKCGGALNQLGPDGNAPMHTAVLNGDVPLVESLLDSCSPLDMPNGKGRTPLHLAAQTGNGEVASLLLQAHCNVESLTPEKWTPLHVASFCGSLQVLRLLLQAGAQTTNATNNGRYPIHLAVSNRHVECVEALLSFGADPSVRNINGETPLHLAAAEGNLTVAKLLVDAGASSSATDYNGASPLDIALKGKKPHLVRYFGEVDNLL